MRFQLRPILAEMRAFYRLPRKPERFRTYLAMLQGDTKDDMVLPITGYNPMGGAHVLDRIDRLRSINAEGVMVESIRQVNAELSRPPTDSFRVVLNLADDEGGSWTNRYTTDFEAVFRINALVQRRFCTPYVYTSETYTPALIRERTRASLLRTVYRLDHPRPRTLAECVAQETFVARGGSSERPWPKEELALLAEHFDAHRDSDDYALVFNFFYGDAASAALGYATFGVGATTGFDYARSLGTA